MDESRRLYEFALALFGRNPADASNGEWTAARRQRALGTGHAVVDHGDLACVWPPRLGYIAARSDDARLQPAQRPPAERARRAGRNPTVRMKHHGRANSCQRRSRQQARTVDVDQIAATRQGADLTRQSRGFEQESGVIGRRLRARRIGSAIDACRLMAQRAHALEHRAVARHRDERGRHGRQQVEQALLSAAGFAELIEKQRLHSRTANASTKK